MRRLSISALFTSLALFLLYTNWPVVAAQRGIVPEGTALLVPVLLSLAVVHQLVARRRGLVVDRTFLLMLAFLVVLLLATVSAEGYDVAFERIIVYLTEGVMIYFLVRHAVRSLPDLRVAMLAVLTGGALLAGLTVFQMVTGDYDQEFMGLAPRALEHLEDLPPSARQDVGLEDRARGPVDEPNRFAQILMMAGALGVVVALNAVRRRGAMIAWICVLLLLGGVLLTYSRGALVTLVVLLMMALPLRLIRPARLVGVLTVGVVLIVVAVPGFTDRVASMAGVAGLFGPSLVEPDGPTKGRTTEMLAALAAYTDHPVLGVGPGQYLAFHSVRYQALPEIAFREIPVPRRAHNLYLEIAAETGTFGLIVFMAIPMMLLLDLRWLRRSLYPRRPDLARIAIGFTLALLAYLGTGVFLHLAFERYYWVMVALAAAAVGVLEDQAWEHPVERDPADAWPGFDESFTTSGGMPC